MGSFQRMALAAALGQCIAAVFVFSPVFILSVLCMFCVYVKDATDNG